MPRPRPTRARALRRQSTDAERRLRAVVRNRCLDGLKIRRQMPIGPFVADFVCVERRLIIELDGGQHGERVREDEARTAIPARHGCRVVRFWNTDVPSNLEGVLARRRPGDDRGHCRG